MRKPYTLTSNTGFDIDTINGDCTMHNYQGEAPPYVSQFWVDRGCRVVVLGLVVAFLLFAVDWMVGQWQPFLAGPISKDAIWAQLCATVPNFWMAISVTFLFGRYYLRFFSSKWPDSPTAE